MVEYRIPSNCERAVIFDAALMFIFEPMVVPFYYTAYKSDVEDFFTNYCLDCSLRGRSCSLTGAVNRSCSLGNYIQSHNITKCIQMPLPRHVLVIEIHDSTPSFGYETEDCIRALRIGNIGAGGGWCSGDVSYDKKDPSSIYNGYMQSIHNSDLTNVSAQDYEQYLLNITEDFTNVTPSYSFECENWGNILNIVPKPTSIVWQRAAEEGFYKNERNLHVKIQ